MHPWHDIPTGETPPYTLNAIIEIPMGSKVKYELEKVSGFLKVDRILHASMHYPLNYGFIPQTYCDDKDPLDVLVVGQYPVAPGSIMKVRPLTCFQMIDNNEEDDKIIAVHIDDPYYSHCKSEKDIGKTMKDEIRHFFESYKALQHKQVSIEGELNLADTLKVIEKSIAAYLEYRRI